MPLRILIVDEEDLFRRGLALTFAKDADVEVAGQARTGEEAIAMAAEMQPSLVLTELRLRDMSGVQLARTILKTAPATRLGVIARSFTREELADAARTGVRGYFTKDITLDTLVDAVKRVGAGETYVSPAAAELLIEEVAAGSSNRSRSIAQRPDRAKVTEREREVLDLIVHGGTNRDIAARLMITENTVKVHLRNILDKLHLRNRQQAAAFAVSSGLVELQSSEHHNGDNGNRSTPTTWRQKSG